MSPELELAAAIATGLSLLLGLCRVLVWLWRRIPRAETPEARLARQRQELRQELEERERPSLRTSCVVPRDGILGDTCGGCGRPAKWHQFETESAPADKRAVDELRGSLKPGDLEYLEPGESLTFTSPDYRAECRFKFEERDCLPPEDLKERLEEMGRAARESGASFDELGEGLRSFRDALADSIALQNPSSLFLDGGPAHPRRFGGFPPIPAMRGHNPDAAIGTVKKVHDDGTVDFELGPRRPPKFPLDRVKA